MRPILITPNHDGHLPRCRCPRCRLRRLRNYAICVGLGAGGGQILLEVIGRLVG